MSDLTAKRVLFSVFSLQNQKCLLIIYDDNVPTYILTLYNRVFDLDVVCLVLSRFLDKVNVHIKHKVAL